MTVVGGQGSGAKKALHICRSSFYAIRKPVILKQSIIRIAVQFFSVLCSTRVGEDS